MNLEADRQQLEKLLSCFRCGRAASIRQIIELTEIVERIRILDKKSTINSLETCNILKAGLKQFPKSPELAYKLAKAISSYGDRNGDPRLFRRAAKLYKDQGRFHEADYVTEELASDFLAEGVEAMDSGDLHKAEQNFQRAIRVYPLHADAWIHFGIIQEERGNWMEAARLYWKGLQLGRIVCHEREALSKTVSLRARVGKTHYWGEIQTRPYPRGLYFLGHLYYARRQFDLALPFVRESLQMNPNDNTGARFIVFSLSRPRRDKAQLAILRKKYGSSDLARGAGDLEIACFGSLLLKFSNVQ